MTSLRRLLDKCPDSKRHPLVVESQDWDTLLTPALAEMGDICPPSSDVAATIGWHRMNRTVIEAAYLLGYERCQSERVLKFAVVED